MNKQEAIAILREAVSKVDRPEGELYFVSLGEDKAKFYFDICAIPKGKKIEWKSDKYIADHFAISPPWYVDKVTGQADINWGMPDSLPPEK